MRRVLIVSREAPPAVGPHSIRVAKLIKYLPAVGWEPTLLTTPLDHAWAVDASLSEDLGGATVIRIPRLLSKAVRPTSVRAAAEASGVGDQASRTVAPRTGARSGLRAALSRVLFPDRDVLWAAAVIRTSGVNPADYDAVLTTAPPFSTHLVGAWMASRKVVPWVAEYRDNWTTNPLYRRRFPQRVIERRLERVMIRRASAVIAMSEPAAGELREGMGLDPERVVVAANGFDPDDLPAPVAAAEHFEITYLGALDERRDPRTFFRALAERSASDPQFGTDLKVRLVGNVSSWAADVARSALGRERVGLDGLVSHREALSIGARAAVLLGITTESEAGAAGLTSKVFDYLGLRRPILMLAPASPAKVLVESLRAGQTAPPTDIDAIRTAIGRLYDDWRAGTEVVVTRDALSAHTRLETARSVAAALDFAITG